MTTLDGITTHHCVMPDFDSDAGSYGPFPPLGTPHTCKCGTQWLCAAIADEKKPLPYWRWVPPPVARQERLPL